MKLERHTQQTLALAGIAQSAFLVYQLGRHGIVSQDNLATCVDSLFVVNPTSAESVYGDRARLKQGLHLLQELFQGGSGQILKNPDVMRYFFSIVYLEGKVHNQKKLLNSISRGLQDIEEIHPEGNKAASEDVIKRLGSIYQNTVGTLSFRIQVRGDMQFLQNDLIAAKIRAVLLAGIRSAVLWRQVGGRRWHLFVFKRRIGRDVDLLLNE